MQALRQMGGGVAIAILSLLLVIGGISLSLAENTPPPVDNTPTPIYSTPLVLDLPSFTPLPTNTFEAPPTNTAITLPSETPLPPPPPVVCTPPTGWFQIVVASNDTLYTIAERYKTTPEALSASNCLTSASPVPGSLIYVPPVPTVTVIPCGPPAGWVKRHTVQAGDNLYRIALSYGLTYPQLQRANCMGSSIAIYAGQMLWVPNIPTLTPVPGVTIIPTFPTQTPSTTPLPSATFAPPTETSTFIVTSSPLPTITNSPVPTTVTPSLTPFPSPTK